MSHALTFVIATLCILAICYRLYGVFFVRKVLNADDSEVTPSHVYEDGKDYVPTKKWVNFGSHFAAIAAAGPPVRWLARCWPRSTATSPVFSGCWWAAWWAERYTIPWCCSLP